MRLRTPLEPNTRLRRVRILGDEKLKPVLSAKQLGLVVEKGGDVFNNLFMSGKGVIRSKGLVSQSVSQ